MSAETGRDPTRKRPRRARPRGVVGPRVDRADPFPRALDGAPHGGVEHAAAGDLEVGEAGPVEDLGDPQHLAGRQLAGKRVLREQADGGVDDLGHVGWTLA